ncbi:MAG TPA: hypothetical protein VIW67_13030 [Terriglobales bacterium]|jgi:hypothetical protein
MQSMLTQGSIVEAMPHARLPLRYEALPSFEDQHVIALRRLIWLYFWFLVLEGALRKWIVPSLSTPLLIVRDPLVILIYLQAIRCRRFPLNGPMLGCFFLLVGFVLLALVQIITGVGGGVLVAIYGLRTNFLHLPLIFVIPQVFNYADVLKLGKWILLLAIPMTALMVLQFESSAGSWINAATRSDVQQIEFAMGKVRPSGTFSFATGAAHFFVLATAFVVYALAQKRNIYPGWLVWSALVGVLIVQPVSGSRLLVLGCGLVVAGTIVFGTMNLGRAQKILGVVVLIAIVFGVLSFTSFFREATDVFMTRWNDASDAAGGVQQGIVWRFFGGFLEPFTLVSDAGLIGKGIGMGTNAASAMMTGALVFLLAEGEWARVVLEAGPLLGFSFLLYRVWVAGTIGFRAWSSAKQGQLLAWLLAWDACRSLVTEQISQPTNLGFMVFVAGLCLAALAEDRFSNKIATGSGRHPVYSLGRVPESSRRFRGSPLPVS